MRVLVACEFSGIVRDAFKARGHDAWSCDILPTERPGQHIQADVRTILSDGWDLMIAHPPCTYLAISGARWWKDRQVEQAAALDFVRLLLDAPIPHIALENPKSVIATRVRPADQIVQPWWFGHPETKGLCLWLKDLPRLLSTTVVAGRANNIANMHEHGDRARNRSRTYLGFADAMARQWSAFLHKRYPPNADALSDPRSSR